MQTNLNQLHLTWTLTTLTTKRLLRRKSTWFMLLVGLVPCMVAAFWIIRNIYPDFARSVDKPWRMFQNIESFYFLTFYIPVLSLFLGLGTLNDEIESKNITFTLVRPLNRVAIAMGRFLGHFITAAGLTLVAITMNYFANMFFQIEDFVGKLPNLITTLSIATFGLCAYLAVIACVGSYAKKFAIMGGVIWLGVDTLFSLLPVNTLKAMSIKYKMLSSYAEGNLPPMEFFSITEIVPGNIFLNGFLCVLIAATACVGIALRLWRQEIILSDSN